MNQRLPELTKSQKAIWRNSIPLHFPELGSLVYPLLQTHWGEVPTDTHSSFGAHGLVSEQIIVDGSMEEKTGYHMITTYLTFH